MKRTEVNNPHLLCKAVTSLFQGGFGLKRERKTVILRNIGHTSKNASHLEKNALTFKSVSHLEKQLTREILVSLRNDYDDAEDEAG